MSNLKTPSEEIILGLDPGLADTGYGVIKVSGSTVRSLAYGSIKTPSTDSFSERLLSIESQLSSIIDLYQPDRVGFEKIFFAKNVTTAFSVGQARGVLLLTVARHHLPIHEFTPLQVKQNISGYGKADKKQIQRMIMLILKLDKIPQPDDAADALAIAICAMNRSQLPIS